MLFISLNVWLVAIGSYQELVSKKVDFGIPIEKKQKKKAEEAAAKTKSEPTHDEVLTTFSLYIFIDLYLNLIALLGCRMNGLAAFAAYSPFAASAWKSNRKQH